MTTTAKATTEAHTEATLSLSRTVDSVIVRETVVIRERPDTVTVERERTVWRERTRHDTVVVTLTDTVIQTVEAEKVETLAPLPPSQRATRTPGWAWALAATLAGLIIAQIIRVKNRLNNR